jgi:hypothetical protein
MTKKQPLSNIAPGRFLGWSKEEIKEETNEELANRLRFMAEYGEVEGRTFALREAANRLEEAE